MSFLRLLSKRSVKILRKTLTGLGIDRALAYSIALRLFQLIAGIGSLVLIARHLTAAQQGFYFTYGSILGLQVFFDLGLSAVISQFASHEMVLLTFTHENTLQGCSEARERIASLLRMALRWYSWAALLLIVGLLPSGLGFFAQSKDAGSVGHWEWAWAWLAIAAAGSLATSPILSLIEGCGQVAEIALIRTIQELCAYAVLWWALTLGLGLFSVSIFQTTRLVVVIVWLLGKRRKFIFELLSCAKTSNSFKWWVHIWPLQWKIALSWLCGYFIFQIFNPVLFHYQNAEVAGRMGMSLAATGAISSIAIAWVGTKYPKFGMLVATRDFVSLDALFFRSFLQSMFVIVSGAASCWLIIYYLHYYHYPFSERILDPLTFAILLGATCANHVVSCFAIYLRAHKQEPFLIISIISGFCVSVSAVLLAPRYGAFGISLGYLTNCILVGLLGGTWIFTVKRREWHRNETGVSASPSSTVAYKPQ